MKRVINGKTYNTDTAHLVARYEYKDDKGYDTLAEIYQSKGGAFFVVHRWVESEDEDADTKVYFEAIDRDELERMVAHINCLEILDENILQPPPEAEIEVEPATTVYLRLPPSLKRQIETAARTAELSLNAWCIRRFEESVRPTIRPVT